jgi:hypothetical protein
MSEQEQRVSTMNTALTVFAEVNTKTMAVSTELEKMANNAHQPQLLVQVQGTRCKAWMESEMSEQEQHVSTMNTALSTAISTVAAAPATAEEAQMDPGTRKANSARHKPLRMKTPKQDATMQSTAASGRLAKHACMCYRPIGPTTSERVDCSSLIDDNTNQAFHDKAQKMFSSGKKVCCVLPCCTVHHHIQLRRATTTTPEEGRMTGPNNTRTAAPPPDAPGDYAYDDRYEVVQHLRDTSNRLAGPYVL